jgi:protein TonB
MKMVRGRARRAAEEAIHQCSASLPADAWQRRQQGRVVLEVHVSAAGTVDSLSVFESSGVPSLDQAALTAVRSWRFEAARQAGRAVPAVINVPVRFEMRTR